MPRPLTANLVQRGDTVQLRAASRVSLAAVCALAAGACARSEELNVMTIPAGCDSTLRPVRPGERTRVALPADIAVTDSAGAIVGTVVQRGTGRPLAYAGAALFLPGVPTAGEERRVAQLERPVDTLGGFAFRDVPPGRYTLRVRAVSHLPRELPLDVQAGRVDTLQLELRYFQCTGY